jgi:signal transduction histidine kinase
VVHRLQDFAADVARPAGVGFTVDTQIDLDRVRLDAESCRDLYLLLKEGIANVAKHAQAKTIALEIRPMGNGIVIELRDDGCGFDPSRQRPTHGGHGLGHMRQRAQRLGGSLEISSHAGDGTTIRIECMNMRLT